MNRIVVGEAACVSSGGLAAWNILLILRSCQKSLSRQHPAPLYASTGVPSSAKPKPNAAAVSYDLRPTQRAVFLYTGMADPAALFTNNNLAAGRKTLQRRWVWEEHLTGWKNPPGRRL